MEILLNNIETTETTRRNLLKYSAFCISALAGINALQTSLPLQVTTSENVITSNVVDYTIKPYNVFLISENINQVNKLLTNTRVENVYVYSHTLHANISNKVVSNNNLQKLLLSLGSIIPFDYDITSLDIKSWKVREAFLYISEAYASLQNDKNTQLNEANILASLNIIGAYNRSIYVSHNNSIFQNDHTILNHQSMPIGDIIVL